jgi:hypothetical protein
MKDPKVGERVCYWGVESPDVNAGIWKSIRFTDTVTHVDGDLLRLARNNIPVPAKQVRRLVKRERERIWVFQYTDGTPGYGPEVLPNKPEDDHRRIRSKQPNGRWREFVAVRGKG